MKRIGIAIVVDSGNVLVGIRSEGTVLAGRHEFPGGKCEPRESPAACAIRECREETGLQVQVVETLLQRQHRYDHGEVDLSFYLCQLLEFGSPLPPFQWVPLFEIGTLNFPEANREVVDKLLDRYIRRNLLPDSLGVANFFRCDDLKTTLGFSLEAGQIDEL